MVSLKTKFLGLDLKSPLVLASGIWGTSANLLAKSNQNGLGAGMLTTKSVNTQVRPGHQNPIHIDWGEGLINAVGLPGDGCYRMAEIIAEFKEENDTPVIASIFGGSDEEFQKVTRVLQESADLLELNLSCPNVGSEFGFPFAAKEDTTSHITRVVKEVATKPVIVKLAPNVPSIALIAKAAVEAGADAINAINTVPGMIIDVYSGHPILTNKFGGVSGAAILPTAIGAVYAIRKALPNIPIIGTGGVTSVDGLLQHLWAGADVVGVGSAIYSNGVDTFSELNEELEKFMDEEKIPNLAHFRNNHHALSTPSN